MNCAVIVETRDINLKPVIDRHLQYLPDWDLKIFGSDDYRINNLYDYNVILTSVDFWARLEHYERVLIFQSDSGLLKKGIEDFMQWDYIGAPWRFQREGGNGGLSLRNPEAMIETIRKIKWGPRFGNEDVYFCNNLVGNLAPRSECFKFSCESIFELGTLGYHFGSDSDRFLTGEEKNIIMHQYEMEG